MRPIRVYIAAPYSAPTEAEREANVRVAIDAADRLLKAGFFPYVPHLTHFWHRQHPHGYEDWMLLDRMWLDVCDAVVRLPGDSPGADRECLQARAAGRKVHFGVDEFLEVNRTPYPERLALSELDHY